MTLGHRCSVSPEWAPGASDPPSPMLLLPSVEPLALSVAESKQKLLLLREQLGLELAKELVPISTPAPTPVWASLRWPGLLSLLALACTKGVHATPQGASPSFHCSR